VKVEKIDLNGDLEVPAGVSKLLARKAAATGAGIGGRRFR
jgi:hypothetical protein